MKLTVDLYSFDGERDKKIGSLFFDGKKITPTGRAAKSILEEPIMLRGGTKFTAGDDPKRFMRSLSTQYRGAYLRATDPTVANAAKTKVFRKRF